VLLVREKLTEQQRTRELSKMDKDAVNKYRRHGGHVTSPPLSDKERQRTSCEMEKSTDELDALDGGGDDHTAALMVKCLRLMLHSRSESRARLVAAVRLLAFLLVCIWWLPCAAASC